MKNKTVAVVGLGYVGLPLALAFGRTMTTIGFDLSTSKIESYHNKIDPTGEMGGAAFEASTKIKFTIESSNLKVADFVVVAVPTPINGVKEPDLSPICGASKTVGANLKKGAIVVYESTVYPGVTEDVCVPILEEVSGLVCGKDFFVGYSPERINPGDKEHRLENIIKIVAGQDTKTLDMVAKLYEQVVEVGVYRASSIKVAEAAKVIENTQRDLNIALMNELAIIFDRLNIDTSEVLAAAGTKWNFLKFFPGLVGGHCIGVDPYYLTHRAEEVGYHPDVILAGRQINDGMARFIAEKTIKLLIQSSAVVKGAKVLVMGLTFKENCGDLRNSKVIDVIRELEAYGVEVLVWDPVACKEEARDEYGVELLDITTVKSVDAIVAAVSHNACLEYGIRNLAALAKPETPFIDVKSVYDQEELKDAGFTTWRL